VATIDNASSSEQNNVYNSADLDVPFYACQFKVTLNNGAKLAAMEIVFDLEKA
jgi:hypothetical protein